MVKITINNQDLIGTQNTTWDSELYRMDTTYVTENSVAGSYDPGIPRITAINSCTECNAAMHDGWHYCPYCGKKK